MALLHALPYADGLDMLGHAARDLDADTDDLLAVLSSMVAELIWFSVGFLGIRCGLLGYLLPANVADKLQRCGAGFLLGKGYSGEAVSADATAKALQAASGSGAEAVLKAWHCAVPPALAGKGGNSAAGAPLLPTEALRAVAQALAELEPATAASELAAYVRVHTATLARPTVAVELLEAVAHSAARRPQRADVLEELVAALGSEASALVADASVQEALLTGLAYCGEESRVVRAFAEGLQAGLKLSVRGYGAVARGLARSSSVPAACRWLRAMRDSGHEVPAQVAGEVLKSASSQGDCRAAFRELLTVAAFFPADALACAARDCARQEDVETAKLVEQAADEGGTQLPFVAKEALLKLYAKTCDSRAGELFGEMRQAGLFFSEGLCGALLSRSAESHCIVLAELVGAYLRESGAATLATYKAFMKVYACAGLYDKACDLHQQVVSDGLEPDAVMYGCLVKFALKCNRAEFRQQLVAKAPKDGPQTYTCLLRAISDSDVPRAIAMLEDLRAYGAKVDIATYNSVLDSCVVAKEMDHAQQLVLGIEHAGIANAVTYNTLVKGFCAVGDHAGARRTLRRMSRAGLAPDSASYNSLLGAATSKGDVSGAWAIIEEMEAEGVRPDCYTISIMMTASKRVRESQDADWALAMLDSSGVSACEDDVLFNTVLDACIHRRKLGRLAAVLRTYEASSLRPSVHTYGLLIKSYSLLHRIATCKELWREMVDRGIQPNDITLSCMLDALVCGGSAKEAVRLFREWQDSVSANTVIYSTLLKGCANAGDAESAMEIYRELKGRGVKMNVVAYTTLIDAQSRAGNVAKGAELLSQMQKDGCEPNTITYSTLVKGHCVLGDLQGALVVFNEMLARGLRADAVVFNTLLDGCVRHSDFKLADKLLANMQKYEVTPSNFTLSIIVKMWGKRQQLDRAFEAVRSLPREHGLAADAQVGACLVSACVHCGDPDRALAALGELRAWPAFGGPDAATYGLLISCLTRHRRYREAASLAEEALRRTGTGTSRGSAPSEGSRAGGRGAGPVGGGRCGADARALNPEVLRQLFRGLEQQRLLEEVGAPLVAALRAACVDSERGAGAGHEAGRRRTAATGQR